MQHDNVWGRLCVCVQCLGRVYVEGAVERVAEVGRVGGWGAMGWLMGTAAATTTAIITAIITATTTITTTLQKEGRQEENSRWVGVILVIVVIIDCDSVILTNNSNQ